MVVGILLTMEKGPLARPFLCWGFTVRVRRGLRLCVQLLSEEGMVYMLMTLSFGCGMSGRMGAFRLDCDRSQGR